MSARLSRSIFASLRVSSRARTNNAFLARRNMSAQSHGGQPKKSDLPWAIGAAVLFGPLFLYLVSPSARKSHQAHAVHNDHRDFPTLGKGKHEPEAKHSEIMKDDEGTPADVTATIALAEENDVPNDSQSPETVAATTAAAEQAPVGEAVKEEAAAVNDAPEKVEAPVSETTEKAPEAAHAESATEAPATTTTAAKSEA